MDTESIIKVLRKLKEENKKRKFNESVDLIVNLKNFDLKKESINLILPLPNEFVVPKILAFLNEKSSVIDSITKNEFPLYKDKKKIKKLLLEYDYFISSANLMPEVATTFGRYLGPVGKMPSPQMGILKSEKEDEIEKIATLYNKIVKIKSKEPSLKMKVGNSEMKEEKIAENILYVYKKILDALPKKNQSIKNVLIKFTMSKTVKI